MSKLQIAILISELASLVLIWLNWRGNDPLVLKIVATVFTLIPFIGPLAALWTVNMPDPIHPSLRDNNRYSSDVYDRWIHVLRTSSPSKRFKAWKQVRGDDK